MLEQELRAIRSAEKVEEVVLTEDEVYEELCRIDSSKASGSDEIPRRLLRKGAPWITKPFLHHFNAIKFETLTLCSKKATLRYEQCCVGMGGYIQVSLSKIRFQTKIGCPCGRDYSKSQPGFEPTQTYNARLW